MRALVPDQVDDVDVHEHYARDWVDTGGVRMSFVSSLDGAATTQGLSGGLQTAGDNRVFAALRDLADVVLVGAGTARDEGYRPAHPDADRQARRATHGLPRQLPIAVVSRSLRLDPEAALLVDAAPDARTIVVTCAASDRRSRARLGEVADVVVCGADEVDFGRLRRELADRGLTRVLAEGGPTVFAQAAAADEVDELCLSLSPLLVGPGGPRIVGGEPWTVGPRRLTLAGLLEEDGALFLRLRTDRTR